jgi:hypothetical protein
MATNPTQQTTGSTNQAVSDPTKFKPKNFDDTSTTINNQYFPLTPGTTFQYLGAPDSNTVDNEQVTHDTKKIDGVNCVVVNDKVTDNGGLIEQTYDYYAQDKQGNVWYFGEDATQYDGQGNKTGTEGSWLAGQVPEGAKKKAAPGIIMEANPQLYDSYNQENAYPVAQDHAEVLSLDASASVPYASYDGGLLMTLETSAVEPGAAEVKYYAQGVGQVYGLDLVSQEQENLNSITTDPTNTSASPSTSQVVQLLEQLLASFGASDPGASTLSSSLAANDQSLQQVLAAQHA